MELMEHMISPRHMRANPDLPSEFKLIDPKRTIAPSGALVLNVRGLLFTSKYV